MDRVIYARYVNETEDGNRMRESVVVSDEGQKKEVHSPVGKSADSLDMKELYREMGCAELSFDDLTQQNLKLNRENEEIKQSMLGIMRSKSWKATAPMRKIGLKFRKGKDA